MSDFRFDTYEATVGRFRAFVAEYSSSMIAAGAGKNPNDPNDSGWDTAWNSSLPVTRGLPWAGLRCGGFGPGTWTDSPGPNENRPITCISWFEAFAFCVWDGGRLPTEAEWGYVAAGGDEQRYYPWSVPPSVDTIDGTYAVYCTGKGGLDDPCQSGAQNVGSRSPKGDGRWGHSDLFGNAAEWTLDWYADPYPQPSCTDCANLTETPTRVVRGASFNDNPDLFLTKADERDRLAGNVPDVPPTNHDERIGVRCVRNP